MALVDELLRNLVNDFEAAFPGRIRGYYLLGSYANGTAIETSDLDVSVVFKNAFVSEDEKAAARILAEGSAAPISFDIEITDEQALLETADPMFKLGSRVVQGEDIRERIPLMPMTVWTRDRMHTSYWRLVKLFERRVPIKLTLDYPDPHDEFYGYVRKPLTLEDGRSVLVTRDLLRGVSWMATALVALKAKEYVIHKSDFYSTYQKYVGDEWGPFLQNLYELCKVQWRYLVPDTKEDLRDLCREVLAFENHFLSLYRTFVAAELAQDDLVAVRQAVWVLEQLPLADSKIKKALQQAKNRLEAE
jgi:Nucleotidyltransferase domain